MDPAQLKQMVQQKLATGQTAEAVSLCQKALQGDPDNLFCHSLLAKIAFDNRQLTAAEKHLLAALTVKPDAATLRLNLGQLYARRGQYRQAAEQFLLATEGLAGKPAAVEAVLLLANALARENPALATQLTAWLFQQHPQLAQAHLPADIPSRIRVLCGENSERLTRERFQQHWAIARERLDSHESAKARMRDFLSYFHGLKPVRWAHPLQRPSYHFYPGLRAQPFYSLSEEWLADLKRDWQVIREEKNALLAAQAGIAPYVDEQTPDDPDWKKLEKT